MSKNEEKRKITSRQVGRLPSGKLITGFIFSHNEIYIR